MEPRRYTMDRNNTDQNLLDLGHLFIEAQSLNLQIRRAVEYMNLGNKGTEENLLEAADKVAEAALMIAYEIDPETAAPAVKKVAPVAKKKSKK